MKGIIKLIVAILCLTLCMFLIVSCDKDLTDTETGAQSDTQAETQTDPQSDGKVDFGGGAEEPEEEKEIAEIDAEDQKAFDGKIEVNVKIPENVAEEYDSFSIQVCYGKNVLSDTAVSAEDNTVKLDAAYGKLTVKLIGASDENTKKELACDSVAVWADEYNFASLNGTFPVVYFTLDMYSMGELEEPGAFSKSAKNLPIMNDVPTFVSLEREAAYSWDKLPENVYALPSVGEEDESGFHINNVRMAAYIKELYEINNQSFFNFYCVDNYPELILKFFAANGIPDESFHATLISDGTATAEYFKEAFGGSDAKNVFIKMANEWSRLKASAQSGSDKYLENVYKGSGTEHSVLARYPIVMAYVEDNIDWWCSRDLYTELAGSDDVKSVISELQLMGKLKIFGINDMLSILTEKQQESLKALFHFDGQMFDSTPEGKESLVIIGASPTDEQSERGDLEAFLNVLKAEYGDKYVLYYKGHPKYPVELDSTKAELFEEYGLINLEASIAAELIMFYCPDITLAGWSSSTFKSVEDGKFLVHFDMNKEDGQSKATNDGYGDSANAYYKVTQIGSNNYVTIEYRDNGTVKYYDVTNNTYIDALPSVQ